MLGIKKLYAEKAVVEYIQREFELEDLVLVSPDAGGAKRYGTCRLRYLICLFMVHM
jgi:ribose-phosphate pyrophosphokinase